MRKRILAVSLMAALVGGVMGNGAKAGGFDASTIAIDYAGAGVAGYNHQQMALGQWLPNGTPGRAIVEGAVDIINAFGEAFDLMSKRTDGLVNDAPHNIAGWYSDTTGGNAAMTAVELTAGIAAVGNLKRVIESGDAGTLGGHGDAGQVVDAFKAAIAVTGAAFGTNDARTNELGDILVTVTAGNQIGLLGFSNGLDALQAAIDGAIVERISIEDIAGNAGRLGQVAAAVGNGATAEQIQVGLDWMGREVTAGRQIAGYTALTRAQAAATAPGGRDEAAAIQAVVALFQGQAGQNFRQAFGIGAGGFDMSHIARPLSRLITAVDSRTHAVIDQRALEYRLTQARGINLVGIERADALDLTAILASQIGDVTRLQGQAAARGIQAGPLGQLITALQGVQRTLGGQPQPQQPQPAAHAGDGVRFS